VEALQKNDKWAVKETCMKVWNAWDVQKEYILEHAEHWFPAEKKPRRERIQLLAEAMKTMEKPDVFVIAGTPVESEGEYTADLNKVRERIEANLTAEHLDLPYEGLMEQLIPDGASFNSSVVSKSAFAVQEMRNFCPDEDMK